MKTTALASTFALLCVSPLGCSNDDSIGDDQQATEATSDDDALSTDDTVDDGADGDAMPSDDSMDDTADDDSSNPLPSGSDDDTSNEPEPTVMNTEPMPSMTPVMVEPVAEPAVEPVAEPAVEPVAEPAVEPTSEPAVIPEPVPVEVDAGTSTEPEPVVSCDETTPCSAECPTNCEGELVTTDLFGRRYDAVAGCFELSMESAGTLTYEADNPVGCTAAESLGVSPSGECWSFNSGCQPEGFQLVRTNPSAPSGVDHECSTAESCPIDWVCEPGVVPAELDRGCEVDDDCYQQFYAGPCGCSSNVIGFNRLDVAALGAHREACVDPTMCECPSPGHVTDSGEAVQYLSQSLVECVAGQCVTRRDPTYCAESSQCINQFGMCVDVDALNCRDSGGDCTSCQ